MNKEASESREGVETKYCCWCYWNREQAKYRVFDVNVLVFVKAVFYPHCCFLYTSIVWWMN